MGEKIFKFPHSVAIGKNNIFRQWRHKQFCFGGAKHTLAPFCQILVGLIYSFTNTNLKYWWGYSPLAHPLVTPLLSRAIVDTFHYKIARIFTLEDLKVGQILSLNSPDVKQAGVRLSLDFFFNGNLFTLQRLNWMENLVNLSIHFKYSIKHKRMRNRFSRNILEN